ncbi:MAG: hypothetical protein Q4G09_03345 [Clostridia bacterium]|nr:hypothetical protein [Clostridia bacterium]
MNNEDMSDVFEKINNIAGQNNISPDMVNNLFNMFNNSDANNSTNNNNQTQNSDNASSSGIDFETIMKMKTIIDKMNVKDDPRSNLLQSLKPYLKDSRQSKVDQYIQLMNMSKVIEVFPFMGGDKSK